MIKGENLRMASFMARITVLAINSFKNYESKAHLKPCQKIKKVKRKRDPFTPFRFWINIA